METQACFKTKGSFYLLLFLALYYFLFPLNTSAQWYTQQSSTTENLNNICFTDSLNGFTVGDKGVILHTENGGMDWIDQTFDTTYHLLDVFFLDQDLGWISGFNDEPFPEGRLFHTTNGGDDWELISDWGFQEVYFFDSLDGVAAGGIYVTSDGGMLWEEKIGYLPIYGIHFTDSLNGWATGGWINGSTGYVTSYILNTSDGGVSWDYQFEHFARMGYFLYDICFTDYLNGYAVGGGPGIQAKRIILKTSDSGGSWETLFSHHHHDRLRDICFPDQQNGWVVGGLTSGVIMHLEHAGELWSIQTTLTEVALNSICFPDKTNGWIAGDNGTILHNSQTVHIDELVRPLDPNHLEIFPNPFSSSTTLEFESTQTGRIVVKIHNQLGELIETIQENTQAGKQTVTWNATNLPSGIYYIRIQFGNELITRKMIKLK